MNKTLQVLCFALCIAFALGTYYSRPAGGYYQGSGNVVGSGYSWGEWGYWTSCSASCGDGYRTRNRTCHGSARYTLYGSGSRCHPGSSTERESCNNGYCKVHGGWTHWGHYSDCSVTCGAGVKTRSRYCTNPVPAYGGNQCYGDDKEEMHCQGYQQYCPVHGGWTNWGHYSDCSASCGAGVKTRSRYCTNPAPAYGGNECYGDDKQEMHCQGYHCPVHGGWSDWGDYSDCSASCGAGVKTRRRYCTNPTPAYGGNQCYGDDKEETYCQGYHQHCPVHGGWTHWGHYSDCSVTCGAGVKTRSRYCTNPAPAYGGNQCYGDDKQEMHCQGYQQYCPVHGGWTHWGHYSDCSVTCGAGVKTRSRYCTNPTPAYGGNQCYGDDKEEMHCQGYRRHCPVSGY